MTYLSRLGVQCLVYHSIGSLAQFWLHETESVSEFFLLFFEVVFITGLGLVLQILIYITVRNPFSVVLVIILALLSKAAIVNEMRIDSLLLSSGFVLGWFNHLRARNYN